MTDIIEKAINKEIEADDTFIDEMIKKSCQLRDESEKILKKEEKEDIIKKAKKFGLTLSDEGELIFDINTFFNKFIN